MKSSWASTFVWLLVLGGAGVGGKIAYDKYGKTMLGDALDGGFLAPIESAISFDDSADAGSSDAGRGDARPDVHAEAKPVPTPTHSAPKHHDAGTRRHR